MLDSRLLLEKYVEKIHPDCECDPTFNRVVNINDYNLLSISSVTSRSRRRLRGGGASSRIDAGALSDVS